MRARSYNWEKTQTLFTLGISWCDQRRHVFALAGHSRSAVRWYDFEPRHHSRVNFWQVSSAAKHLNFVVLHRSPDKGFLVSALARLQTRD